ncbi:MAG TPA: hypothetical protein ENF94_00700 [Candidatus Woesearchaeota archaeon]|nr:MAG: hypothetical protein DRJ25_02890 [Candidatus Woesearchaeota archaeon]HDD70659.1 hypothetical protein [Candidatus Woesearchaeota archaeon]
MKSELIAVSIIVAVVFATGLVVMFNYGDKTAGAFSSYPAQYVRIKSGPLGVGSAVKLPVESCSDSDGGKNFMEKGVLRIGDDVFSDLCDRQSGNLIENWCMYNDRGQPVRGWAIYKCPNRCVDGACLP